MPNDHLEKRTAKDIDKRVKKILRDLGNPEPPLRLEEVRELLSLDRVYYSLSDSGVLQETVHRLRVAGKQIVRRPTILFDAVKKWDLKALWVPDRKRILIDVDLPSAKKRWGEAHEVGHSIIPWHQVVMHGDQKRTLSYVCEQQIEAEANFAAGRLIFLQEEFSQRLLSKPITFGNVKKLSREFGNTITSTLWRTVETVDMPLFGLVSQHPNTSADGDSPQFRYFLRSHQFKKQFGNVTGREVFYSLKNFCYGNRGPIGSGNVVFEDVNGEHHEFFLEAFYNHHDVLTLGTYVRAHPVPVAVPP